MTTTTTPKASKPTTRQPSTNGKASKPAAKKDKPKTEKGKGATETAATVTTAPKATTDTAVVIAQAREHYGCSAAALAGKLKADGYDGRTLAERLAKWVDARQQAEANASGKALADAIATVEPAATDPTTTTEPNPHGWETIAPVGPIQPEPELIPADTTTEPAADLAPVVPPAAPVLPVVPVVVPTVPRTTIGRTGSGGVNLTDAHRQWADRPADERYWTIADALEATKHHRETAREVSFPWDAVALIPAGEDGREIALALPDGTEATLTNYAAGQLCRAVGAPQSYLAKLPTDLAISCLESGLVGEFAGRKKGGNALIHQNGYTKLRSLNSDRYARFWNCEVFEALLPLTEQGWRTPPARPSGPNDPRSRRAEPADCLKRSGQFWGTVQPGQWIAPSGIYASDHDMFAFLINEDMRIDDGTPDGLARGFFVSNSEVGAGALKLKAFWYRDVCSNHIVWGAEHVVEVNVRHVGTFDSIRQKFHVQVKAALDSFTTASLAEDQRTIDRARSFMLTSASDPATARKEVLQALIAGVSGGRTLKPASGISVDLFKKSLDLAVQFADIDHVHPYSLWGAVNGLTRYSQSADVGADYADERAKVDSLTGKLMKLVGA